MNHCNKFEIKDFHASNFGKHLFILFAGHFENLKMKSKHER